MRDDKIPVSLRLLDLRIAEVKSEVTTHRLENKAEFKKIEANFTNIRSELRNELAAHRQETKNEFSKLHSKIDVLIANLDAKFEKLETQHIQNKAAIEEQNVRINFALDGYTIVYEKLQETDARVARIEKHIFGA